MEKDDKTLLIIMIFISLIALLITASGIITTKIKSEQPRYFIEFKGSIYELKEVE